MTTFLSLIRIRHWAKNLFIFIPAFFAGVLFKSDMVLKLGLGFLCFSLMASAIYILNDYRDVKSDRNHPVKRYRPLAANTISVPAALAILIVFMIASLAISYSIQIDFFMIIVFYMIINLGYSLGLKNISILDIMLVASGFLLRTIGGGVLVDVAVSRWMLIMIFLLALFLAMAKRLDDFLVNERSGSISRKTVKNYNLIFIHAGITLIAGIIIVSYLMYTISDDVIERMHNPHLYFTGIFVIAGILRYLQITFVEQDSGSPTEILYKDSFILATLLCWLLSFFLIIYL